MKEDKRKTSESSLPLILIIIGIVFIISSGLIYLNFTDGKSSMVYAFWGTLIVGIALSIFPFIMDKRLFGKIITNKRTLLLVNSVILIFAIIGISILLTYIGFRHNVRFDFTYNHMLTLSEQTLNVVRGLKQDVEIYAFYPQGTAEGAVVEDLLKEYKNNSSHLTYKFIDPARDPMTTRAMQVKQIGAIIVQTKAKEQTAQLAQNLENQPVVANNNENNRVDINVQDLFYMPNPYERNVNDKPKFTGEQAITSAIMNVTSGKKRKIAFVTGHKELTISGERPPLANLVNSLKEENIGCIEINLLTEKIPNDVNMLFIAAPQEDFHEDEMKALEEFAHTKDKTIFMSLDYLSKAPSLISFALKEYGIAYTSDLAIDTHIDNIGLVPGELASHEITTPIKNAKMLPLFYMPRTLNIETKTGFNQIALIESRSSSIGKRLENVNSQSQFTPEELRKFNSDKDIRGPLTLAALVVRNQSVAPGANALFFTNGQFLANGLISYSGNKDLVLNAVNWGVGQLEMVSVTPKSLEIPQIQFDRRDSDAVFIICLFASPLLVLILGLIVFLVRREVK